MKDGRPGAKFVGMFSVPSIGCFQTFRNIPAVRDSHCSMILQLLSGEDLTMISIFANHLKPVLKTVTLALFACATLLTPSFAEEKSAPKALKMPNIVSISVLPANITLNSGDDARSFIVTGKTDAGFDVDLTSVAKAKPDSAIVHVDRDGYLQPLKAGKTNLLVSAGGHQIKVPLIVKSLSSSPVSFVREVEPILSKAGCNAGTCHGSAKGKNGFKLSLRGYDPEFDHHALIDDVLARRFNRSDAAQSLMLLKPTGAVPHRGGVVFKPNSRYYALLKRWIEEGAKSDSGIMKRVASLEVLPTLPNVTLPGMTQKVLVLAHYPDGSTRDVTREAVITSSLPEVATVTPAGLVTAIRRGEAAVLVRYEGTYATNSVTTLGDRTGYVFPKVQEFGYIDKLVDAKLKKVKAKPSFLCDDATFLRRVSIDLTGLPPSPETVRAFVADTSNNRNKREKLIDSLLDSSEYIDRWTNKWSDLLDSNSKYLGSDGVHKFRNWIYNSVAQNKPYDKFVHELITATGDSSSHASANYLRVVRDTSTATENVTQLFLGVRFSCAKCHDHPFERWTQNQYYQFGAYFAQVGFKPSPNGEEVVFNKDAGEVTHPKTGLAVLPAVPVGRNPKAADFQDRRGAFADWLTDAENPFFSRALVNRLWSYMLGKGIIDPVDDIRASNPPSNPALLEALNQDFVKSGFDMKHILRTIVLSRVYQSSISTNRWNSDDNINFSHAAPRRLEAEQLLDAINLATGTHSSFAGAPSGTKAGQLADADANGADGFLDLFGRPARQSPCECERSSTVSLGQALNLINGPTTDTISNPKGRIVQLLVTNPPNEKIVEEMFLSTLCRLPSKSEMATGLDTLKTAGSKTEGAQDLLWALLNSPAFLFNR